MPSADPYQRRQKRARRAREGSVSESAADQFRKAASERGILVPDDMTTGRLQRCVVLGRSKGNKDGAYLFHPDGLPAGGFENLADGKGWENWHAALDRPLTDQESASYQERIEVAKKLREAEEAQLRAAAADRAQTTWEKASPCEYHPYLATKGVQAHGLRVLGDKLVMPFYTPSGAISTLQTITATGSKIFQTGGRVKGCFYMLGQVTDGALAIAEGFATAASVHEATGLPVAVAGNAGNLRPVAEALRLIHPKVTLVICADDDPKEGNPGLTAATNAAAAVKGRVAIPEWKGSRPERDKDFNDLAKTQGLAAVKACVLGESEEEAKPSRRLPTIKVNSEAQVTTDALKALTPHQDFYQRSGELVRVVPFGSGQARLHPVHGPWLREVLSKRARFADARGKRLVPDWLPAMIVERRDWPEVPEMRAIVTAPVFLEDGRVLAKPGLDRESGLFFANERASRFSIPTNPGLSDAKTATERLFDVVADFPFALSPSPACHRAAWLAFLLTLVARFAVDGPVPFALLDAPSQGSGKGLLTKITSLIALGETPPATAASSDEEELRKALLPMLERGDRMGWLDDVSNPFGGRTWNALITAWPEYSDRVLGKSVQRRVPALTVWAVTGNNLSLRGDSTRRALHIRLEPTCEKPEERGGWRHENLRGWVAVNQPGLLSAALTILRAYHLAGRPNSNLPTQGSFEEWSRLVRDCVYWVTGEDVTGTQRALGAVGDEGRLAMATFFDFIRVSFSTTPFDSALLMKRLTKQLTNEEEENDRRSALAAADALKLGPGELSSKSLGAILRTHRGAVVGSYRLDSTPGNKRTTYRLAEIAVSAVSAVSANYIAQGA